MAKTPKHIEDIYPLSPMQRGMLFHTLNDPDAGVYVEQIRLLMEGLDERHFRRAWEHMFERFAALRTSVAGTGSKEPAQVVRRKVTLPWQEHDCRSLTSAQEQQAFIEKFLEDDRMRGFALNEPSLARLTLIRLSDERYQLVWMLHHIILDGWSGSLILADLLRTYSCLCRGEEPELPAVRPFRDYIVWLRKQDSASAEAYWRKALAGLSAPTDLGGARRSAEKPGRIDDYAISERRLPAALTSSLKRAAGSCRVTLNTFLQGGWAQLLAYTSGQDEVVFGTVSSGRPEQLEGIETMVGMFVNTLPLRISVSDDIPVSRWLQMLQAREAERRQYAYSPLWRVQQLSDAPAGAPLFESLFVFENYPIQRALLSGSVDENGLTVRFIPPFDRTGYPLLLLVQPSDELSLRITYDAERFDTAEIALLLERYEVLLQGMAEGPDVATTSLPLFVPGERERLLRDCNQTERRYPEGRCLHQLFEAQAQRTPDAVAIAAAEERISYRQLDERANKLAQHLVLLGAKPDQRVGLCMERSPELIVGVLAVLKAGAAYLPLDPTYPSARLAYMMKDASVSLVVGHRATAEQLSCLSREADDGHVALVCLDGDAPAIEEHKSCPPATSATEQSLAYVLYTSGSTGTPKGVAMPHAPLVNLTHWQLEESPDGAESRTLQLSPLSFDVSCQEIFATLAAGGTLYVVDDETRRDAAALLEMLCTHSVTRLFMPYVALQQLATTAVELNRSPQSLREVITAGEQLQISPAIVSFFKALPQCSLVNQYGPTECHVVAAHTLSGDVGQWPALPPIGRPIANTALYVLDAKREPVPAGVAGELYIGGAAVSRGYVNNTVATEKAFVPDAFNPAPASRLYKTGDKVRQRPDGIIDFLGRLDDQVKLRGFRVEVGEVEAVAMRAEGVSQAAAVVREDRPGDRRLVLYVEQSAQGATIEQLRQHMRIQLPDYMVPAAIMQVEQLPRTANGKVHRRALLSVAYTPKELRTGYVAPRGPIEQLLTELWSEVLGVDAPGVHDNFFDLGGHSLLATRLVSRLRSSLKVELPLRLLFTHPTIAQLAAQLPRKQGEKPSRPALEPQSIAGPRPLSFAQQRLWFLDQMGTGAAYHMPWAFELRGELDVDALDRSINAVVARHETLRTRFVATGGKPMQHIAAELRVPLGRLDLSALGDAERDAELDRFARDEASKSFDLARGPLIRPTVVQLDSHQHVLFLSLHHIVFDGWSIGVMNRELLAHYRAYTTGEAAQVPELPVQYADFAQWQNAWLTDEALAPQLVYWRDKLNGAPAVLDLPADHPRPALQSYRGGSVVIELSESLTLSLKKLSRRQNVTLAMTLLAAFKVLLARYSGEDDIIVGSPIANRTQREIEDLIGFFVNSLVLRDDLSNDPRFSDLLARVHTTALQAYEHQDLPFERLVDELAPERDQSRHPLFQVVFAMQNASREPLALPGLKVTSRGAVAQATRFDLELHVSDTSAGLSGGFCYNRDLFDRTTIERLADHYKMLLESVVDSPQARLSELPMMRPAERRQIEEWNDTAVRFPIGDCLHERFERQVDRTPNAVALTHEHRSLSYQQLEERANRLAHVLREHGVGPDTLVGLCLERRLDLVVGILGILKAGGAYVPLDLANPEERIAFIVEDAAVSVIVTDSTLLDKLPDAAAQSNGVSPKIICIDRDRTQIAGASAARVTSSVRPDHLAYVIYTSGSTGKPKGALIEHRHVVRLFDATNDDYRFGAEDVWTLFHSFAFDFSVWELWGALLYGGRVVIVPQLVARSPEDFCRLLSAEGVTVLNQTPSAFRQLMAADERLGESLLKGLRLVIFGGEALELNSLKPWFSRYGDKKPQLVNMYGITETTVHVTCRPLRVEDVGLASGSVIGRPLSDMQVYILDPQRRLLPVGVPGEMYVGGGGVCRGYLGRPGLTTHRFVDNPFDTTPGSRLYRTGDIARYLPNGELEYLGRNDDQIKLRGYRIELGEIEAALCGHPWVHEAVVMAREQEAGDKRLIGYVVPDSEGASTEEGELIAQWEELYDLTYGEKTLLTDPAFNIIGWNSSYTAEPIAPAEMRLWVDEVVTRVLSYQPQRVLELGCGTGLLLFNIAPHTQEYIGADFSQAAIDYINKHVAQDEELSRKVTLYQRPADDLSGIELGTYDAVIINSVIQYFPSIQYLLDVIKGAVAAAAPGGRVHLGDIRSLPLLGAYHASVQLYQAADDVSTEQLRKRVLQRLTQEEELVVDPAFFLALQEQLPRVSHVSIMPKRMAAHNELTMFRYEVILHIEEQPPAETNIEWLDWEEHELSSNAIASRLRDEAPLQLGLRSIPNSRTLTACAAAELLLADSGPASAQPVSALREELERRLAGRGVDPAALVALGKELPYRVDLSWARDSEDGRFDACFTRCDADLSVRFPSAVVPAQARSKYGNHPLQAKMTRQLAPRLVESLKLSLPGYMLPSAFVMLEELPLTVNGKVDRRALPEPEWYLSQRRGLYMAPRTATQRQLAAVWAALLGIEKVGIHDDFFDLGGHSLLATQLISRIGEAFQMELGLRQLFDKPTVAALAELIEAMSWLGEEGEPTGTEQREGGEL